MPIEENWLAAYLYYGEPWERFLAKTIKPFAEGVLSENLAKQFFFIRYWERGPHIRLRFKGNEARLEQELKPRLTSHFQSCFEDNPSDRVEPDWLKELPKEQQWFPNNSVQYIEYEPETERYGGPAGLLIAEKQFEASSRAVLSIIKESNDWSYERALGAAIQLHLAFASGMGMELSETKAFYSHIFQSWAPSAYGYGYDNKSTEAEIKQRRETTLKTFKRNFDKQCSTLVPFHESVWRALKNGVEFDKDWLNIWVREMNEIFCDFREAQKQERLTFPQWFRSDPQLTTPEAHQQRWSILSSYIHMTNNRLGILNRDEGYLGYLINRSLELI